MTKQGYGIFFILFVFSIKLGCSQDFSNLPEIKQKYKSESIIVLNMTEKMTVTLKKGEPQILLKISKQYYYTDYRANRFSERNLKYSHFRKLKDVVAYSYIPEDGKYKTIKVKDYKTTDVMSDDVFHRDLKSISFNFPQLREDAISRLDYSIDFNNKYLLSSFYFQDYFPMINYQLIIDVDPEIDMEFAFFNADTFDIKRTEETKGNRRIYSFSIQNVGKFDDEPGAPSEDYFMPHMVPYIKSYQTKGKTVNVLRNINDLYQWYHSLLQKVDTTGKEDLVAKAKEITKDITDNDAKAKAIFRWVQNNVKYIAIEVGLGGFVPENPAVVFKNRYGDCKGKASILHAMLHAVGVPSYFTWVGSRDLPYKYSVLPTPRVDNHMIITFVNAEGEYVFLDATDKFIPFGLPTSFIQGKEVLIDKNDTFEIRKIPILETDINFSTDSLTIAIDGKAIKGHGRLALHGYYFDDIYYVVSKQKDYEKKLKYYSNYLEKGNNKFEVSKASENVDLDKGILTIDYDFITNDYVLENNDELFVNMNVFKKLLETKIKDSRKYPYEFEYKNMDDFYVFLKIPDGYKIINLPDNSSYSNRAFDYAISYVVTGDSLCYHIKSNYKAIWLNKEDFDMWNIFFRHMRNDFREVVTLKKE